MYYIIPDYYKEFHCIADQCEDTCCAGWEICIDDMALARYQNMKGKEGKAIRKNINRKRKSFKQDREKNCAFLKKDGLCHMYEMTGEKGLCRTCHLYPRHIEEFENVREITLSASCPEAARILLEKEEPVTFRTIERGREESLEEFDDLFYSILLDAREVMISIAQDRSLPMKERICRCLGIAHDMQGRVNRNEMFSCEDVLERAQTDRGIRIAREKCRAYEQNADYAKRSEKMFDHLFELEHLRDDWLGLLEQSGNDLFGNGEEVFLKYDKEFAEYENGTNENCLSEGSSNDETFLWNIRKTKKNSFSVIYEQIFVYFLFTYFCGAVYDDNIYGKIKAAASGIELLRLLFMGRWLRNQRELCLEEVTEILYRFCREIEHSDDNLDRVERICWF